MPLSLSLSLSLTLHLVCILSRFLPILFFPFLSSFPSSPLHNLLPTSISLLHQSIPCRLTSWPWAPTTPALLLSSFHVLMNIPSTLSCTPSPFSHHVPNGHQQTQHQLFIHPSYQAHALDQFRIHPASARATRSTKMTLSARLPAPTTSPVWKSSSKSPSSAQA